MGGGEEEEEEELLWCWKGKRGKRRMERLVVKGRNIFCDYASSGG